MSKIQFAKEESDFLGVKIGRLNLTKNTAITDLSTLVVEGRYDICKMVVPSETPDLMEQLERLGLPYSINDVVFHYRADFMNMGIASYKSPDIQFEIYKDNPVHKQLMYDMAIQTFEENAGAYFTNPIFKELIAPQKTLELFGRWATTFLPTNNSNRLAWFAKGKDDYIGFVSVQFTEKGCNPLIAGLLPAYRKKNYYIDFVHFIRNYCVANQIEWTYAQSQLQNMAAYQIYTRGNMKVYRTTVTVNINALLSFSNEKKFSFSLELVVDGVSVTVIKAVKKKLDIRKSFTKIIFKPLVNSFLSKKYNCILITIYEKEKEAMYLIKVLNQEQELVALQYLYR